jgi:hypothetical protein
MICWSILENEHEYVCVVVFYLVTQRKEMIFPQEPTEEKRRPDVVPSHGKLFLILILSLIFSLNQFSSA